VLYTCICNPIPRWLDVTTYFLASFPGSLLISCPEREPENNYFYAQWPMK